MKKNMIALIALIAVFALVLTGCGKGNAPDAPEKLPESGELGLSGWTMSAYAWSSNNGATVSVTAAPNYYAEGMTADLVVRVEGEDVEKVSCEWNGSDFTAEADLNAADGLCYYIVLRTAEGQELEVEINTPNNETNETLINMAHALETYCHMGVTEFALNGDLLTVMEGSAEVRLPHITRDGKKAQCEKAEVILSYNEEEVSRAPLTLPEDLSSIDLKGVGFTIPAMEDDQQLSVALEVKLTDGQILSAPGGTWFYTDGQLVLAIG